jgi:hypothetical protein
LLSRETLSTALYAIATDYRNRAKNLLLTTDELDDAERERLMAAAWDDDASGEDVARRLGDALREMGAEDGLANECYRLAFYLSDHPADLAESPLYAYFLAHRAGRLLDKWVHYFPVYERYLGPYRDTAPRVLEIGVSHGGSLDMWERYLGSSAILVGVDIDEAAARLAGPRRTVLIGDQADPDFLASIVRDHGPFDIVIDDGGHTMEQQIASIQALFPALNDGGVYLVEDCHTSYLDEFGGGRGREGTFIEWAKTRIDDMHGYHQPEPVAPLWTDHVDSIHFHDSMVMFLKERRFVPFSEQVGEGSFIHLPRNTSGLVGEMLATRDAAIAEREVMVEELTHLSATIEEEFRLARGELTELRPRAVDLEAQVHRAAKELNVAQNDLLESWDQLKAMRQTLSWRITAPLRALRRRGRKGS